MHEIVIPMVPSRNILRGDGWWRNAHNDRVVWRQKVQEAFKDVEPNLYGARVICDWQGRPKPVTTDSLKQSIERELRDALEEVGVRLRWCSVWLEQSGRGAKGETTVILEWVS